MPVSNAVANLFGMTARVGMEQRGSALLARPLEYIGVEIELEQPDLNRRGDRIIWPGDGVLARSLVDTHSDGSLRNGIELVFREPLFGERAIYAIEQMYEIKRINGLADSVRTSTHVHINYSDASLETVVRAAVLNAIVEPYIVSTAGTHREANCYAVSLRGSDFLTHPRTNYNCTDFVLNQTNSHRYLGFNMAALAKYGTIEYRYFGGMEQSSVMALINMLLEQKSVAESGIDVRSLLEQYDTIREFIFEHLPFAAAFLKLDSVNREDDIAWRDEVLARIYASVAFSSAFGSQVEEEEEDDGVPEEHISIVDDPALRDEPMPDDAFFSPRSIEQAAAATRLVTNLRASARAATPVTISAETMEAVYVLPDSNFDNP